ncbi:MAG: hypothetical protein EBX50_18145, partial [Chitinophagia bacterium]|nr:hypothetical protein [Chitinophagia bacterium]
TVKATDLNLGENYSNTYTTSGTWTTAQTVIPTGTLTYGQVYLIKIYWSTTTGSQPYDVATAFLINPASTNGSGNDNSVTVICSTHTGGTGTFAVNMFAGSSFTTSGLKVALVGFADPSGSLSITATRLK